MLNSFNVFRNRVFPVVLVLLAVSASAFANSADNKIDSSIVNENLLKKLRVDLANDSVEVKVNTVEEYQISKEELGLKGDAMCITNGNQVPLQFDMKVNLTNKDVVEVKYDFAEDAGAANSNEEVLMKTLISKISRDYKTENIVIAIDSMEKVGSSNNGNKFLGTGEVRIGDLVWNKIKFDVTLDNQTKKAENVVYKLEK